MSSFRGDQRQLWGCELVDHPPNPLDTDLANDAFNHIVRERSEVFGTLALFKALAGLSDQRNADTESA